MKGILCCSSLVQPQGVAFIAPSKNTPMKNTSLLLGTRSLRAPASPATGFRTGLALLIGLVAASVAQASVLWDGAASKGIGVFEKFNLVGSSTLTVVSDGTYGSVFRFYKPSSSERSEAHESGKGVELCTLSSPSASGAQVKRAVPARCERPPAFVPTRIHAQRSLAPLSVRGAPDPHRPIPYCGCWPSLYNRDGGSAQPHFGRTLIGVLR